MEKLETTIKCINESFVTVIAGVESEVHNLINTIISSAKSGTVLIPFGKVASPLTVEDIEEEFLTCKEKSQIICVELNSFAPTTNSTLAERSSSLKYSVAITELIMLAEAHDVRIVAVLPSEKRSTCISVYRKIPEEINDKVRVLLLENFGTEYRLWIEAGADIGGYILYAYDSGKGEFKEKQ